MPFKYQCSTIVGQFFVPVKKLVGVSVPFVQLFEQGIPLGKDLVITTESLTVALVDLAQRAIQITAANRRGTGNQFNIFRQEHIRVQLADDVHRPLLDTIEPNILAQAVSLSQNRDG